MRIRVFFLVCFIKRCEDLFTHGRKDSGGLIHFFRLRDRQFGGSSRLIRQIRSLHTNIGLQLQSHYVLYAGLKIILT